MNKEQVRTNRIHTLVVLASKGATRAEIIERALAWGVSKRTADEYHLAVVAIVKRGIKHQENMEKLSGKPSVFDSNEEVIGSGIDIIKPKSDSVDTGNRSWFKL